MYHDDSIGNSIFRQAIEKEIQAAAVNEGKTFDKSMLSTSNPNPAPPTPKGPVDPSTYKVTAPWPLDSARSSARNSARQSGRQTALNHMRDSARNSARVSARSSARSGKGLLSARENSSIVLSSRSNMHSAHESARNPPNSSRSGATARTDQPSGRLDTIRSDMSTARLETAMTALLAEKSNLLQRLAVVEEELAEDDRREKQQQNQRRRKRGGRR